MAVDYGAILRLIKVVVMISRLSTAETLICTLHVVGRQLDYSLVGEESKRKLGILNKNLFTWTGLSRDPQNWASKDDWRMRIIRDVMNG